MVEGPIIDSHVHLWDPQRFRMPWIDVIPPIQQRFERDTYAEHTRGVPIEQGVYLQVDTTPAYGLLEARWAIEQPPLIQAVVPYAPVEDGRIVASYLDALRAMGPRIKGVRRLIQAEADPDFHVKPAFLEGLRLLAEYRSE